MEETEKNMNDFSGDLVDLDEEFEGTEAAEKKEFVKVPNGRYQVIVDKVLLDRAQNTGDLMLKWELVIISGKFMPQRLFRNNMIVTPDNLKWLKTDLLTVGVDIKKISELPMHLKDILDTKLEVSVKNYTKKEQEYQNVYLQKKLDIELPQEYLDRKNSAEDFKPNEIETNLAF